MKRERRFAQNAVFALAIGASLAFPCSGIIQRAMEKPEPPKMLPAPLVENPITTKSKGEGACLQVPERKENKGDNCTSLFSTCVADLEQCETTMRAAGIVIESLESRLSTCETESQRCTYEKKK